MKHCLTRIFAGFIFIIMMSLPLISNAQPDTDPGCNPDLCPVEDQFCCVPIDGGLSLLIAAGIGLGAKKAYDRKKAAAKIAE